MAKIIIKGRAIDSNTRIGVSGLRVEAWDKALILKKIVGSAVTDSEGEFSLSFDERNFKELFLDRRPVLFFRVYSDNKLVLDTKDHILWNFDEKGKKVELLVDGARVGLPGRSETPRVIPGLKLDELGSVLSLDAKVLRKLKEKNLVLDHVGEATLATMVNDNIITPAQKNEIQLTVGITQLSGENLELTKALKNVVKDSPVELASWNKADWMKFLQEKKIALPPGEIDLDSYAENLRNVVEQSFPSEYFLKRVVNGGAREKTSELVTTIAPLFQNNTVIIPDPGKSTDYDWKDAREEEKTRILAGLAELMPIVNSYRQLGLAEILNRPDLNVTQKQSAIEKRFASLSTFYNNNPEIQLQYADFATINSETKKDNWNWKGIAAGDQPYVRKQMAASQRVFTMVENHETGELLMKNGYDSAYAITSMTEDDFLDCIGLGWEKGKAVYARAVDMAAGSSHWYEAIRDVTRGSFRHIALNNQARSLVNDLKEIDGYAELFGSQDYCECEDCKSILSPAAYFTDLMLFVNENISKKLFIPSLTSHPLYLKCRRPDLWTLKLSCQNTNMEIPYLQVVNEVLGKYLSQAIPTSDVYESLRIADWSCRQPFNLALEETRLYLSHFDLRLAEIYKSLNLPQEEQRREQLLLSVEELQIISMPSPAGAQKRFGHIALANFEVQEFIQQGRWLTRILVEEPFEMTPSEIRQFQTLTHPEIMGAPFRVLVLKRPNQPE